MQESGSCKIKPEFIVPEHVREISLQCVSSSDQLDVFNTENKQDEVPNKKIKLSKKLRGQNKARGPTFRHDNEKEICNIFMSLKANEGVPKCERINCKALHDVEKYLKIKPADIGESCYNFEISGCCNRGLSCRFGNQHITGNRNKVDEAKYSLYKSQAPYTLNQLKHDLQVSLRKKTYDFSLSESLIKFNDNNYKAKRNNASLNEKTCTKQNGSGKVTDEDIIKWTQREKKKINWINKLFLSPLTTVGNLPFRRICKEYGADVTCGEMVMCASLLQGQPQEWALVKRHKSEDLFGVQLCANNPHLLTKCAQLLEEEISVDFIDINLGCPIELVYRQGGGCGLLRREKVLEICVRNASQILSIPLTVKSRSGVTSNDNIALKLMPKFREWGVNLVTVHGRSREQRYTKQSDWTYIQKCAQEAAPMSVVGNGDILSYEDYKLTKENYPELTSVMIGRGALIKPWLFAEIKEQKLWDISSSERFDILKKYTNYGLEHWGSDTKGVENTRRFMLEWLSFLYRYIPVGLLERPPQKINERPPYYRGRDDLETLMASPSASDWIQITEMLLGPVPEGFIFLPKHKANSYK